MACEQCDSQERYAASERATIGAVRVGERYFYSDRWNHGALVTVLTKPDIEICPRHQCAAVGRLRIEELVGEGLSGKTIGEEFDAHLSHLFPSSHEASWEHVMRHSPQAVENMLATGTSRCECP